MMIFVLTDGNSSYGGNKKLTLGNVILIVNLRLIQEGLTNPKGRHSNELKHF